MLKINKSKNSVINAVKILILCAILILLSGVGAMAVTTNLKTVKIVLASGYEMTVLTNKQTIKDILEENNIILQNNEKVSPNMEENLTETRTITILDKSKQEVEIAKISESGLETSLNNLLDAYSKITEKIEVIEEKIPFETITKDISDGESNTRNTVLQEGEEGIKQITYKVKYQNDTEIERTKISEEITKEPVNKIVQVKSIVITTRSEIKRGSEGETAEVATTGTVADYQNYARERCYDYGWTDTDFSCLVNLWNRESGWNPQSYNRSSGAYGIPQALPGSKMASAGADYRTNYKTQINWGLGYIKSRYGSPTAAWSAFKSKGWY
ncbi:MAG: G5 domain-containing protein [Clostridia bacterium]|nr:G5 domain-containing protein [Clostridia bacterium]